MISVTTTGIRTNPGLSTPEWALCTEREGGGLREGDEALGDQKKPKAPQGR